MTAKVFESPGRVGGEERPPSRLRLMAPLLPGPWYTGESLSAGSSSFQLNTTRAVLACTYV